MTSTATVRPHELPGLRLTRRGRRLVRGLSWGLTTVALALSVLLVWMAVATGVAPGASAGDGRPGVASGAPGTAVSVDVDELAPVQVSVRPGDTLWGLAREHAPHRDPRSVVLDVVALNDLSSTAVAVGDRLLVPTR